MVPPVLADEESHGFSATVPMTEGEIPDIDIDNIVEEDDSSSSEGRNKKYIVSLSIIF